MALYSLAHAFLKDIQMSKRIVTFVLEFDQDNRPSWLWDAMTKEINGVRVLGASDGDLVGKLFEDEEKECPSCGEKYE